MTKKLNDTNKSKTYNSHKQQAVGSSFVVDLFDDILLEFTHAFTRRGPCF